MTDPEAMIAEVMAVVQLACEAARGGDVELTAALCQAVRLHLREHVRGIDLEAEPVPPPKRRDAPEP